MRDLFVIMGLLAIVAFAWAGGYVFGQMRGTSDMERELDAMREVCFRTIGIYASLRDLCRELWMKARLTCSVLSKHMDSLEPVTAAIIARDIRNHWDSYEGPNSMEKFRTTKSFYDMDVRCFTDLLHMLDERSKECDGYPTYIPYLPTGYRSWDDVPEEIRFQGGIATNHGEPSGSPVP